MPVNRLSMSLRTKTLLPGFGALLLLAGCASHPRDFIPNGAGQNLPPTNPAHIQVLDAIPRGMVIGTILVDRSKAKDQADIVNLAREKAAAVGGDFIVWEDSVGLAPSSAPSAGGVQGGSPPNVGHDSGTFGHGSGPEAATSLEPTFHSNNAPKAQFTVGIFLSEAKPH